MNEDVQEGILYDRQNFESQNIKWWWKSLENYGISIRSNILNHQNNIWEVVIKIKMMYGIMLSKKKKEKACYIV